MIWYIIRPRTTHKDIKEILSTNGKQLYGALTCNCGSASGVVQ